MKPIPRRSIAFLAKPLLLVSALSGAGLLAYGIHAQSALEIESRHDGGRRNPWRGLPGCILMPETASRESHFWETGIASATACGAADWSFTEEFSIQASDLLNALKPLIAEPASWMPVDNAGVRAPDNVKINGRYIAKGRDIAVTIDADRQTTAQALAACMTGDGEACEAAELSPEKWADRYEGAAARMLALVDIDIATGGIRAMASAHSRCYQAHWRQTPAASELACPPMPAINAPQTWRLDNHARYTTAMPGSIDKPSLMLALLRSPDGSRLHEGTGRQWVLNTLQTSDSAALFDKLFCADARFDPRCNRIAGLAKAADDFGFNGGQIDLLNGQATTKLHVPNARLFLEKNTEGKWDWLSTTMPDSAMLKRCSAAKWQKCAGLETAKIVSELWGQGNAQATALSAAQMIARLGAAANGSMIAPAHVLTNVGGVDVAPDAKLTGIERHHARLITQGMNLVARPGGTAHAACLAVLGAATCKAINFASLKTGTPAFTHDRLTASERVDACESAAAAIRAARNTNQRPATTDTIESARCAMQPYKWTVALIKDSDAADAPFTRAVAVLAERNYRQDGVIDSAYDRGVNVAAELVFRYIEQTRTASGASPTN